MMGQDTTMSLQLKKYTNFECSIDQQNLIGTYLKIPIYKKLKT